MIRSYEHDLDVSNRAFDLSLLTKFIIQQYRVMRTLGVSEERSPFKHFHSLKGRYTDLFYKNVQYKIQLLREVALRSIQTISDRNVLSTITRNLLLQVLDILSSFGKEVESPLFYDFVLRYVNLFDRNRTMVIKQRNIILKENLVRHSVNKSRSQSKLVLTSKEKFDIASVTDLESYLTQTIGTTSIEENNNVKNVYGEVLSGGLL